MRRKGSALLMLWAQVPADKEHDFNRWCDEEHLPECLAVPGFLSAGRYQAIKGGPKHLVCYELENTAVIEGPAYKEVMAAPTPWTKHSGLSPIATTVIRNVYTMIHPKTLTPAIAEAGMAPALQIGRMDVPRAVDIEWNDWYNTIYVPNYEKVPGVIRGRRYRALEGTPQYLTLYELEHPKVSDTAEYVKQRYAVPISETMRSHMTHAEGSPGVYVKTLQLNKCNSRRPRWHTPEAMTED